MTLGSELMPCAIYILLHYVFRDASVLLAAQAVSQLPDIRAYAIARRAACVVEYENVCHERMSFRM